jgi:hypothetical protein
MGVVGDPVKLYCVSFTMHTSLYVLDACWELKILGKVLKKILDKQITLDKRQVDSPN